MFYGKVLAGAPTETGGIGLFQYNVMIQPGFHLDSMWLGLFREYQRVSMQWGEPAMHKCAARWLLYKIIVWVSGPLG